MKKFNTAVIIGRFQIPHSGHERLIQEAARLADKVVILIGSVGQPRTPKNPFTFEERKAMLDMIISNYVDYTILPIRDQIYNTQHWVVDVVNKVNSTLPKSWSDMPPKVALVGHKKDHSSNYLDLFPQWKLVDIDNFQKISATNIRESLFKGEDIWENKYLDNRVKSYLQDWCTTTKFFNLKQEFEFIEKYKSAWASSPYPPTFVTVDAVVVQSGHLLMIKRKSAPGKGLWALPGGFVNQQETMRQAVVRELVEETKIKLQPIVLDRAISEQKVYDDPSRSLRGRTITQAFLIELVGHELPRIKGSDDAEKARWIPLNEVFMMGDKIYEDHLDIILNITGNK